MLEHPNNLGDPNYWPSSKDTPTHTVNNQFFDRPSMHVQLASGGITGSSQCVWLAVVCACMAGVVRVCAC